MSILQSIPYPEYTTTQRDALTNVVSGFEIKNTTLNKYQMWDGSSWINTIVDSNDLYFDATVGTGGDYATVTLALNDSKYSLKVVSDVLEKNDIIIPTNKTVKIDLQSFEWNLQSYNITIGNTEGLFITGNYNNLTLLAERGAIKFNYSIEKILFYGRDNFIINNIIIYNNSTVDSAIIAYDGNFENIYVICSNHRYSAFGNLAYPFNGKINNFTIKGGGTNCYTVIHGVILTNERVSNGIFDGEFKANVVLFSSLNGIYENIIYTGVNNVYVIVRKLTNLIDNSYKVYIDAYGSNLNIISDSNFGYVLTFRQNSKFRNCYIHNNATLYYNFINTDSFLIYENCTFNGNVTISGNYIKLLNCRVVGSLTNNADNNTIDNCLIGGNLLNDTSADSTIVSNCRVTGTVTDNGTNTIKFEVN